MGLILSYLRLFVTKFLAKGNPKHDLKIHQSMAFSVSLLALGPVGFTGPGPHGPKQRPVIWGWNSTFSRPNCQPTTGRRWVFVGKTRPESQWWPKKKVVGAVGLIGKPRFLRNVGTTKSSVVFPPCVFLAVYGQDMKSQISQLVMTMPPMPPPPTSPPPRSPRIWGKEGFGLERWGRVMSHKLTSKGSLESEIILPKPPSLSGIWRLVWKKNAETSAGLIRNSINIIN